MRCKDRGVFLIPLGNQLKEQVGALNIHGQITDLINDQNFVFGEDLQPIRQMILKMGRFELLDQGVTIDVVSGIPMSRSLNAQSCCQMGLTNTGRPEKYHVFCVLDKPHGGKLFNLSLVYGGLKGKIEGIQGFF